MRKYNICRVEKIQYLQSWESTIFAELRKYYLCRVQKIHYLQSEKVQHLQSWENTVLYLQSWENKIMAWNTWNQLCGSGSAQIHIVGVRSDPGLDSRDKTPLKTTKRSNRLAMRIQYPDCDADSLHCVKLADENKKKQLSYPDPDSIKTFKVKLNLKFKPWKTSGNQCFFNDFHLLKNNFCKSYFWIQVRF